VTGEQFPDRFLPPVPGRDREAWAWAREEAHRLPPVVLAALDPFTLRDRIVAYERTYQQQSERGALANALVLRAVLDRTLIWQADRLPTRPSPQRGQGGAER
jgi:hypothetical protein